MLFGKRGGGWDCLTLRKAMRGPVRMRRPFWYQLASLCSLMKISDGVERGHRMGANQ